MNRQSFRAFGIAVFLIGAFIYSMNMLSIPLPGINGTDTAAQKEIQALQDKLAAAAKQQEKAGEAPDSTPSAQAETSATVTLTIYRGITSYDISRKLQDAGIIDNALQFELFLVNGGYSKRLQIGDFTIANDMSDEDIATLITTPQ